MTAICWYCVKQIIQSACQWTIFSAWSKYATESAHGHHILLNLLLAIIPFLLLPVSLLMLKKMKGRAGKQSQPKFISCLTPFLPLLFQESLGKQA